MANYRTTVILKTDIVDSTHRLAKLTQSEMGSQRKQHRDFIADIAMSYRGSVFDQEGDSYWVEFPSVTDAVLAAIEMHQSLRAMQAGKGEQQRLAIRAMITIGDILRQEVDNIGMAMSLTARIESITPPDEIYLSHAAWLVLNKAEVQTSFVSEFNFKGFKDAEKIYKVDQKHRVRVLKNQFIVITDIRGWTEYARSQEIETVEHFLTTYDDIINEICNKHGGIIRNASGDLYFLTFTENTKLFNALEDLAKSGELISENYHLGLSIAAHKGDINIIRSYLFSNDIHVTAFLERLNGLSSPAKNSISVVVSGKVREGAIGTKWESQLRVFDKRKIKDEKTKSLINEQGAYSFFPGDKQQG